MGGLEDAEEYHISCLCPEGFLATTSPLPVFLAIAKSVSLLTSWNQDFLGTWRGVHACQVQIRHLVLSQYTRIIQSTVYLNTTKNILIVCVRKVIFVLWTLLAIALW